MTEVVIAARFRRTNRYALPALGDLAQRLAREGFGKIEERPGYEAPVERFGQAAERSGVTLQLLEGAPPIRYWFLNDNLDGEVRQLQPNWFAANWRKVAPEAEYGQWKDRWTAFERWLTEVEHAIGDPELDFDQVEVTYINHIEPQGVWQDHGDAPAVFTSFGQHEGPFLPKPEQYSADRKYLMRSPERPQEPVGRLHVSIGPAFRRPAESPIFVMNLTARGTPIGSGRGGVEAFAELAHEWIVRGFAELTTDAMHAVWEREQ